MTREQLKNPALRRQYFRSWRDNKIKCFPGYRAERNAFQRKNRRRIKETDPEYHARLKEQHRQWLDRNKERIVMQTKKFNSTAERKERLKGYALKRSHGLTLLEWKAKLAAQDGRCAICQSVTPNGAVDHDHQTGTIRDILCMRCNVTLSFFENHPELVKPMHDYLAKWETLKVVRKTG